MAFVLMAGVRFSAARMLANPPTNRKCWNCWKAEFPSARVSGIVDDRGIDFNLTSDIEQKVRDAGGADDVVEALRQASQRRAAADQPRTGGLMVKTTPGEAQVYLNDEPKGMTSVEGGIRLPDLNPGNYNLRVSLPGYQSFEKAVTVSAGEDQTLYVTLVQKSPGNTVKDSPVPSPDPPPRSNSRCGASRFRGLKTLPAVQFYEGPHDLTLEPSKRVSIPIQFRPL